MKCPFGRVDCRSYRKYGCKKRFFGGRTPDEATCFVRNPAYKPPVEG